MIATSEPFSAPMLLQSEPADGHDLAKHAHAYSTICASKTMPIARSSRLLQRSEGHNHAKGQPGHLEEGEAKGNVKKTGIISERRTGDDGEPDARVSPPRDTHTGQSKPPFFLEKEILVCMS